MAEDTVVRLPRPGASVADDPLLEVLRSGARQMLQQVVEVEAFLDARWDPAITVGEWWDRLAESGWGFPTWPTEWFGRGGDHGCGHDRSGVASRRPGA